MADLNALYGELTSYIQELGVKFVDKFIPANPATPPTDYAHDVRAYCVLCHAAFEDYMETVVLAVASHAVDQWVAVTPRKINDVVPALLSWHGAKMKIDDNENSPEQKPFDYLRPLILQAKGAFSREVFKNHGVSILYLRNLLIPVAIEINPDPNLLNSLKKLAEGRGNYAHKGKVKTVLAPEDAKKHVQDVLTICDDVRVKALANMI
jgi:hypothetical protein